MWFQMFNKFILFQIKTKITKTLVHMAKFLEISQYNSLISQIRKLRAKRVTCLMGAEPKMEFRSPSILSYHTVMHYTSR